MKQSKIGIFPALFSAVVSMMFVRPAIAATPEPAPPVGQSADPKPPRASRPPTELGHDAPTPRPARGCAVPDKPIAKTRDKKKDVRDKKYRKKAGPNVDAKDKNRVKNPG